MDEYLSFIEKYPNQKKQDQLLNPVWHVHSGRPPEEKIVMPFSMLLNLVGTSNAKTKDILWKFINKFHPEINPQKNPILDKLTDYAIKYFKDEVEPKKKFKNPSEDEKLILLKLADKLQLISQKTKPEEIQTIVYTTGKENGFESNLRDWFKLIYQVLFGEDNGPRMGFFISFFGVEETIKLIKDKIK